jgi:UDP-N-acetylmuramoyl-L-alanyl-D-glutamate--2,6-diaminopimelate ligase
MEVTSHGLDQKRVDDCNFAVGVFTNLSDEHLDWHQSMANYFKSKAHLFELLRSGSAAVINVDDPYGAELLNVLQGRDLRLFTYGQHNDAAIRARDVQFDQFGNAQFWLDTPRGQSFLQTQLFGQYNIDNALAAVGCGLALNIPLKQIVTALSVSTGAPGRFQRLNEGQDFSVIIDYAHTPDGFNKLFSNIRRIQLPASKLIVVFGCAGFFRDPAKRPTMGRIASEFADIVVLTEEDTRNEDAWQIMRMIETGINKNDCEVHMIEDRAEAIEYAVSLAKSGDILLVLGKGDENSMDIRHPSSWNGDVDTTRRALQKM